MKYLKTYEKICHSIEDLKNLTKKDKKIYSKYLFKINDWMKYIAIRNSNYFRINNFYRIGSVDISDNRDNESIYALYDINGEFILWITENTMKNDFTKAEQYEIDASKYNI